MLVTCVLGAVMRREANGFIPSVSALTGMVDDATNSTYLSSLGSNSTTVSGIMLDVSPVVTLGNSSFHLPYINPSEYAFSLENVANCSLVAGDCKFGLFNDYQVNFRTVACSTGTST